MYRFTASFLIIILFAMGFSNCRNQDIDSNSILDDARKNSEVELGKSVFNLSKKPTESEIRQVVIQSIQAYYKNENNPFTPETIRAITHKLIRRPLVFGTHSKNDLIVDAKVEWSDYWKGDLNTVIFLRATDETQFQVLYAQVTEFYHPHEYTTTDIDHDGFPEFAFITRVSPNGYIEMQYDLLKLEANGSRIVFCESLSFEFAQYLYDNEVKFLPNKNGVDDLKLIITLANDSCKLSQETKCATQTFSPIYKWIGNKYEMQRSEAAEFYKTNFKRSFDHRFERM